MSAMVMAVTARTQKRRPSHLAPTISEPDANATELTWILVRFTRIWETHARATPGSKPIRPMK
ncbi:hypothetical protein D3C80_1693580 [compost metagenome]